MKSAACFLLLLSLTDCSGGNGHYYLNVGTWLGSGIILARRDIPADTVIRAEDLYVYGSRYGNQCRTLWGTTRDTRKAVVGHKTRHAIPCISPTHPGFGVD